MATVVGARPVGVVLAGGGARAAYEVGALAVLLRELGEENRPTVMVGNSAGAINAMYMAANAHLPIRDVVNGGINEWEALTIGDVVRGVVSLGMARRIVSYLGEALGWPRARLWSLLDTAPLESTIGRIVNFDQIEQNRRDGRLHAAGVVATSALTRQSVMFHDGGGRPADDPRRLIRYFPTRLRLEHVLGSVAIPAVFPAGHIDEPEQARGWYIDGGTRLNTPIKPAMQLGAERIVIVGIASLNAAPGDVAGDRRPDALAGIGQVVYGLLADRIAQDVHTLAHFNESSQGKRVPYIFIAPEYPGAVEELAYKVFRDNFRGWFRALRARDLALIGRLTGAMATAEDATLLSLLLFHPDFIRGMMELGREDAERWVRTPHDAGIWQIKRL
jgi:NTE family protein